MMRTVTLLFAALLACAVVFAQANPPAGDSTAHPAQPAASLPQDRHEGLTVAADSYVDVARAKNKFGKANPMSIGILPVEVTLRNETSQPIHINLETIQLTVHFESGRHQDLDWIPVGEVADAVAHPHGPSDPHPRRFPIGLPSTSDHKADKLVEILKPLALDADIVPPLATIHGFLFFDLNGNMSLAENASLYMPDVTTLPANKPLMFFEVRLGKQ
ncbi:MAG: hypothetical protein LAN36_07930 [Acidobacteriia bacterium]|nr:hypothetical protein [Terriglobia bacterium]